MVIYTIVHDISMISDILGDMYHGQDYINIYGDIQ